MEQRNSVDADVAAGPLISMADYARIHGVARTVLEGINKKSNAHAACIFFSIAGAVLLQAHHKLPAEPKVGSAFYSLGGTPLPNVLAFARPTPAGIISDGDGFHCWVECRGWAIDFMAPVFQDSAQKGGTTLTVPPKMFQRRLGSMAPSYDDSDLANAGDFFLEPNPAMLREIFGANLARPSFRDLVDICKQWYQPSPKTMRPKLTIGSDDGTQRELTLRLPSLKGAW